MCQNSIIKVSLVCKLLSYGRMSMVSFHIMAQVETFHDGNKSCIGVWNIKMCEPACFYRYGGCRGRWGRVCVSADPNMPHEMSEHMPEIARVCIYIYIYIYINMIMSVRMCQILSDTIPDRMSDRLPDWTPDRMSARTPEHVSGRESEYMSDELHVKTYWWKKSCTTLDGW
jgi:hypothetical protein